MSHEVDRRLLLSAAGLAGVAALAKSAAAGPLNPPSGPIASTAKPIGEIEPRIAINSTNTPGDAGATFRITASGSYYLAGNVLGQSGRAMIAVNATDVTVDLNGFALNGQNLATAGVSAGTNTRVRVLNGSIRSVAGPAVALWTASVAENLTVQSCADGISTSDFGVVRRCAVLATGGTAVASPANIATGDLSVIEDCIISNPVGNAGAGNALRVETMGRISRCSLYAANTSVPSVLVLTNFNSIVEGCVLRIGISTTATFISVQSGGCIVQGNLLSSPNVGTFTGIVASGSSMIADNNINNLDTCVDLGSAVFCTVVRNKFSGATTTVSGSSLASSHIGPSLTPAGVAAATNPHANYVA